MVHSADPLEPWLRGTRQQTHPVHRAVLHALDMAREDFARWVWPLDSELLEERPHGLPSVGFQARHIARSLDRLLTYAEGGQLSPQQRSLLAGEHMPAWEISPREEFEAALKLAEARIVDLPLEELQAIRYVGGARLPVPLAALLIHLADHTQRHAGQAVTTAKVLRALHAAEQS